AELAGEDLARRFRRERQILADLRHPDVARLLDGGTAADGRPYLVMEYVEGEPIDRYCDRLRLSVDERLKLFRRICGAVHAAHQSLIVHRDLKPANILVTAAGEPKLLDFGIAKLLGPERYDATATVPGLAPLTLEYASPEQLGRQLITTASDVYSLGVLLYELLTGGRPFQLGDQPVEAFLQQVREQPPPPPSSSLVPAAGEPAGDASSPETVSRARASRPGKLRRRLAGDLDNIVLKALRKRPRRRYASADELARDVERHLAGRPVQARPDTVAYRTAKFVRRHRWKVAFATALFTGLVALSATLVEQNRRIRREQVRTRAAMEFLADTFEPADPEVYFSDPDLRHLLPQHARGDQLSLREVLDLRVGRIDEEFTAQPELRAELKAMFGELYRQLGEYDAARSLLDEALELRRRHLGPRHASVADSLRLLGDLHYDLDENDRAESRFRESLAILERLGRSHLAAVERVLSRLAEALRHRGDLRQAEEVRRRALDLARRIHGPDHERLAANLYALGDLLRERTDHDQAEALFAEALSIYRRLYDGAHPRVVSLITAQGLLLQQRDDFAAAEEHLEKALSLTRQAFGDEHPKVAEAQRTLAELLLQLGRFAEAEKLCRNALTIDREIFHDAHPQTAASLNLLGLLRRAQGALDQAERDLLEALSIWSSVHGENHPVVATAHTNLGDVLRTQDKLDGAVEHHLRALEIFRQAYGEEHPQVATAHNNLAATLRRKGDPRGAAHHYRQALEIFEDSLGTSTSQIGVVKTNLARLLRDLGQPVEAERFAGEALEIFESLLGEDHPNVGVALAHLAGALQDQSKLGAAESALGRALEIYDGAQLPPGDRNRLRAQGQLGEVLAASDRFAEAEAVLSQAYDTSLEAHGPADRSTVKARQRLAELYRAWNRPELLAQLPPEP
ncbi:MAG: serine/threonine protein kinase, partial [bacterium]|nr:serine/threonine protein kinase [bacterium]